MKLHINSEILVYYDIILTRTFHPVGQGAFYSEVFRLDDKPLFTVVYDCGTETGAKDMDKTLEQQIDAFKQGINQIDILFLSHFHADHIKGLDELLKGIKVCRTVIPMLPLGMITLTRVRNLMDYGKDALTMDKNISDLFGASNPSEIFGEIIAVLPDGVEDLNTGFPRNVTRTRNGEVLSGFKRFWEYLPFNSIDVRDSRAVDFETSLRSIPGAVNADGSLNVSGIIRECRSDVRKLYQTVMKGANDNLYTMTVESRPVKGIFSPQQDKDFSCLYFGDFDSKKNDALWKRFKEIYNYSDIGTVQIPHHGSIDNWREEMVAGTPRTYVVSAGTTNSYHHPEYWIVHKLRYNRNHVRIVSEKTVSKYKNDYDLEIPDHLFKSTIDYPPIDL